MQWTGWNDEALICWCGERGFYKHVAPQRQPGPDKEFTAALWVAANQEWLGIETGEWVAKDSQGFYPIKDAVFGSSYEFVAG
jgi:hypothetical protein